MLSGWLTKQGAALLLGALAKLLIGAWQYWRAEQNARELGRVSAEADQERRANEVQARQLEAQSNAPQTVDEAIRRLEEGSA